jgi:hypothetical protein
MKSNPRSRFARDKECQDPAAWAAAGQNRGMTRTETLYWRTHAGSRAWACADSGLPAHYRRILGAMHGPTSSEQLRKMLGESSEKQLAAWLDELYTLGFVRTAAAYGPAGAAFGLRAA